MIGQILGNRYEIIEKIGTGGMSHVYKAKCHLLNRFVAIKILRQEFIDNEDFIKRFKIESQAAASLSHPSIVSIYDVGNQGDTYYIVMELADGITLKDYIVARKLLDWKEAVKIAIQICSALEHAHKNGIVHRDIKPHNIIITNDGVAKVTDFGIARAATFFTVTFTGNAIGSVHYFSPEQARGGYTDHKTDIYSLGVVLYEMLTGALPFDGDSPVSIAYKQIQDEPVPPITLNNTLPRSVNEIVLKAMSKGLDGRYPNATAMLNDLKECLMHPDENFVQTIDKEEKVDSPTLILPAVNAPKNIKVDEDDMKSKDKPNKVKVYSIIALSVVLVGLLGYFGIRYVSSNSHSASEVAVPNLVNKTQDEAMAALSDLNLRMEIKDKRPDDTVKEGMVLEQDPAPGKRVKIPNIVYVYISTGKKDIPLPNVEKKDYREAKQAIERLGLMTKLSYESSETIPIGFVTRLNPAVGTPVKQGSDVEIFVSNGPDINSFKMPDLRGKTEDQAKKVIEENKLQYGDVTYIDNAASYGTVVEQNIPPNSMVNEGTTINLKLSSGGQKTSSQPKNLVSKTISFQLPKDKPTVSVKVNLVDSSTNASKTIYQKVQNTSDSPVTLKISGSGSQRVEVYFDGKLGLQKDINFGEAR